MKQNEMEINTLEQLLDYLNEGNPITAGTEAHTLMVDFTQDSMRLTNELNNSYHTKEEIRKIMSKVIRKEIDESFLMFPPFYTDFGKNTTIGKNVFINKGCSFQDQGGVTICDGALLGHNVVLATLDHGFEPENRHTTYPAPIVIGENVWLGANVTVAKGVTIGENSVIAAGAVVTKDIPANVVAGGIPAKIIRNL